MSDVYLLKDGTGLGLATNSYQTQSIIRKTAITKDLVLCVKTWECPSQPFTYPHSGGVAFGCCPSLPPLEAGSGSRRGHCYALYGLLWTLHSFESVCGPSYAHFGSFSALAGFDSESSGPESYTPLLQTIAIILFGSIQFSFICIGANVITKQRKRNPELDLCLDCKKRPKMT